MKRNIPIKNDWLVATNSEVNYFRHSGLLFVVIPASASPAGYCKVMQNYKTYMKIGEVIFVPESDRLFIA
ncbi:MAG: hypothetical protein ACOC0R_05530 [Mariniphaga sp.]